MSLGSLSTLPCYLPVGLSERARVPPGGWGPRHFRQVAPFRLHLPKLFRFEGSVSRFGTSLQGEGAPCRSGEGIFRRSKLVLPLGWAISSQGGGESNSNSVGPILPALVLINQRSCWEVWGLTRCPRKAPANLPVGG